MRFLFVFSAVFLLGFNQAAHAQGHSLYCSHAESTAASQKCLQRHLDASKKRLNRVYQELNKTVEGDALEKLKELQVSWLAYRDAECSWEASLSENPSLKRVNELSCLARVTDDRADILSVALQDEKASDDQSETQREYGAFPRWMNVVAKQAPKVTWNYKDRTRFDLDCDGDDEFVMTGLSYKASEDPVLHTVMYHVALSENPPVGKPTVRMFDFDVIAENQDGEDICSVSPNMSFTAGEQNQDSDNEVDVSCSARLTLKSKNCQDQVIYWSGTEYALEKAAEILQKEENKKETKKK